MDGKNATSAMSASLLARDVYCVCFPERDGLDSLHGELTEARKKYFTGMKKTVKAGSAGTIKGFDGRLQGKLSRRGFYWRKAAGKAAGRVVLEEAFDQKSGHLVVRRDFRGVIVSRVFFDRDHRWTRSEYYEPWDPVNARVVFKPSDAADMIERFDRENGRTRSTELFPLPYLAGTAEQSIVNARFGEPRLVVSTAEGEFCYCPQREKELRQKAMAEIQDGTVVLMPAWEVRDGSLAGDEGEEETNVTFTSLEEYAKIESTGEPEEQAEVPETAQAPGGALTELGAEEFTPVPDQQEPEDDAVPDKPMEASAEEDEPEPEASPIQAAVPEQAAGEPEGAAPADGVSLHPGVVGYRGSFRDGKISGRGRTEQENGLTAYDGEYRDGRREGFGSYYYKDGNLCYAGFWKDDKKDGLGVSFRDSDHALHVAKWEGGRPGGFVSLFDKDGNLRYGGRIEEGKKQGAGVSFSQEDGTVFVGKWENGRPTGLGSSFDRDGNLLYYGGWKDGKRSGHGTEFDANGGIVFDGEWKDGKYHNGILYQKLAQEDPPDGSDPQWDM